MLEDYRDVWPNTEVVQGDALDQASLERAMVGAHAADVIQQIALAIKTECTVEEIVETIHTHPTFSETLGEAGETWLGQGLHSI